MKDKEFNANGTLIAALLFVLLLTACNLDGGTATPTVTVTPVPSSTATWLVGDLGWGEVTGHVNNAITGEPIPGAIVTCDGFSYTSPAPCQGTTTTDVNGDFVFENIFFHDTDRMTIRVEAPDFVSQTLTQEFFTQPEFYVNVTLMPFGFTPMICCTPPACSANETYNCPGECPCGCGTTCATKTAAPTPPPSGPAIGGCPLFPADNFWNTPVDSLPIHPRSQAWVDSIGRQTGFHMDFGSGTWDGGPIGIPYNLISAAGVTWYTLDFYYPDESDPGPYPIPSNPLIEWGSDHHILIVDTDDCALYEIYDASFSGGQWSGGSGAIWDLNSNALRPETWTSADAAGLPILPGLVRYDEIASGEINHALRFTASETAGYIWPARHQTSDPDRRIPPMGARFRLQADYDISGFPLELQIILQAMKTYGIVLADNGSDWYVSGAPDARWDNDMLHLLDVLTGNDFEAVDTSVLMADVNSGEVR